MNENSTHARTSRRDFLKASTAAPAAALPIASGAYAAASDKIRIGVVGCGGRGTEATLQAMRADDGVRLVAMGDVLMERVKTKRAQLKEKNPAQVQVDDDHCFAGFEAYKHVIESVDVVLVACAAKFHPLYLMAAVQAGKHVFVEKAPTASIRRASRWSTRPASWPGRRTSRSSPVCRAVSGWVIRRALSGFTMAPSAT